MTMQTCADPCCSLHEFSVGSMPLTLLNCAGKSQILTWPYLHQQILTSTQIRDVDFKAAVARTSLDKVWMRIAPGIRRSYRLFMHGFRSDSAMVNDVRLQDTIYESANRRDFRD